MNICAYQLRPKHLGRQVEIKGSRREPGIAGVLRKIERHEKPEPRELPSVQSGFVRLVIATELGNQVQVVPWYKFMHLPRAAR